MAIILAQAHPAFSRLKSQNVPVKSDTGVSFARAASDRDVVTLGFVNLMPRLYLDETVDLLLKRFAHGSHDIRPVFINPEDSAKGVNWEEAKKENLDAVLVTGYAASNRPFEKLTFWDDLKIILDDVAARNLPLLGVCAGAMAIANHYYGISKEQAAHKLLGNYEFKTSDGQTLYLATSRNNTLNRSEFLDAVAHKGLKVLAETTGTPNHPEPGVFADPAKHRLFTLSHLEYSNEKALYPGFPEPLNILDYQYQRDHQPGPKFDPVLAERVKPVVNAELNPGQVAAREKYADDLLSHWVEDAVQLKHAKVVRPEFTPPHRSRILEFAGFQPRTVGALVS